MMETQDLAPRYIIYLVQQWIIIEACFHHKLKNYFKK